MCSLNKIIDSLDSDLEGEKLRLQALEEYNILDTPAEREFDDLVSLASYICGTPISLITLVTQDRQWFKARVGWDVPETPRSISFCQYALDKDDVLEIPDTQEDIRFFQNPLVTGNPNIRFYAGAPLVNAAGHRLGTLCVIDTQPHELSEAQKKALATLSDQVVVLMELRLKKQQLEKEKQQLQQTNMTLNRSLGKVTKELQEPVNSIKILTDSLSAKDPERVAQDLLTLKQQVNTLQVLVSSLHK